MITLIICLILLMSVSFAEVFQWKLTLLEVLPSSDPAKVDILTLKKPVDYSSNLQNPSILPLSGFKNDIEQNYSRLASPYILEATLIDSTGKISNVVMRSLVLNGIVPEFVIEYLKDESSRLSDSGANAFYTKGALQIDGKKSSHNNAIYELNSISWLFPLNFNQHVMDVVVSLPKIVDGDAEISSKKTVFHITEHNYLADGSLSKNSFSGEISNPIFSTSSVDMFGEENMILISHNEFSTYRIKKLPSMRGRSSCNQALSISVKFMNKILHFGKSGTFLIYFNDRTKQVMSHEVTFQNKVLCPNHVSLLKGLLQNRVLLDTGKTMVVVKHHDLQFGASILKPNTLYSLKEIQDNSNKSLCSFLSFPRRSCEIICHTFTFQCCNFYVVVNNANTNQYVVVKYINSNTDDFLNGEWTVLTKIFNKLPELNPIAQNYVLLSDSFNNNNGESIVVKGIADIRMARGCVYLWGNVIILFDLRSSKPFLVLSSLNPLSPFFEKQEIKQFLPEHQGTKIAFLTANNSLWLGTISCGFKSVTFRRHEVSFANVFGDASARAIGIFFSFIRNLHLLALLSNSTVQKYDIVVNNSNAEFDRRKKESCLDLFTASRRQHYVIKPPRLLPINKFSALNHADFLKNDYFALREYSNEELLVHRIASYLMFQEELVNVAEWWDKYDDIPHWYFSDKGFNQLLEYISVNHLYLQLQERSWSAYLSKDDYALIKNVDVRDCFLTRVFYLDKNDVFAIQISILDLKQLNVSLGIGYKSKVLVTTSNASLVTYQVKENVEDNVNFFEVQLIGLSTLQKPSGAGLESVSVELWYWLGNDDTRMFSDDVVFDVKVGCPPGLSLSFDVEGSAAYGSHSEEFTCLHEVPDNIPCIAVAEFSPFFFVEDHVLDTRQNFVGNFTLEVVGGGVGYIENIVRFTEEEIQLYNYRAGDNRGSKSLIWTVVDVRNTVGMFDRTGKLIFDTSRPTKIIFECQVNSPCGRIPLTAHNPAEYYVLLEISNKDIDSSTNCDLTMQFIVLVVGIELNPLSHFIVMLVSVTCLLPFIYLFYLLNNQDSKLLCKMCFHRQRQANFPKISHQLQFHERCDVKPSLGSLSAVRRSPCFQLSPESSPSETGDTSRHSAVPETVPDHRSSSETNPMIKISGAAKKKTD